MGNDTPVFRSIDENGNTIPGSVVTAGDLHKMFREKHEEERKKRIQKIKFLALLVLILLAAFVLSSLALMRVFHIGS